MAKAKLGESIFKAYDIRGTYPDQLDESTAEAIGAAYGKYIGKGKRIVISRDVRLSSESLHESLLKGLSSSDPKIIEIGIAPTPVFSFALGHYKAEGGIMITASHNPKEWNGFKLYKANSVPISKEAGLLDIKKLAEAEESCTPKRLEMEEKHAETLNNYENYLIQKTDIKSRLRVGIDPGNGTYSELAKKILEKAGLEVFAINDEPDGSFPSRAPEPKEESLGVFKEFVADNDLDFGIAFDADGDRGIFVYGDGTLLRGDFALAFFVKNLLNKGEKAVYDVSCSNAIEDAVKERGGISVITAVGRTFILDAMPKEHARFGGEISGHMYFADTYYAEDPLFATLKAAEILSNTGKSFEDLIGEMPHYETEAIELPVDESIKFKAIDILRENLSKENKNVVTLDGIKVINEKGWFILRASNTTPMIRLIAESRTRKGLQELENYARSQFEEAINRIEK